MSEINGGGVAVGVLFVCGLGVGGYGLNAGWFASTPAESAAQVQTVQEHIQATALEVAKERERAYLIVVEGGDRAAICFEAGLVAGLYLEARDVNNYRFWKDREKRDCRRAGL